MQFDGWLDHLCKVKLTDRTRLDDGIEILSGLDGRARSMHPRTHVRTHGQLS